MRNKHWRFVRPLRRMVQWSVLVLLGVLPWLNMHEWTRIYGSLFALDVYGIPFSDPVTVFWPMVHGEFPILLWGGLGLTLVLALLFGRVFCGWLCPYGLLSEYAYAAHAKAQAVGKKYAHTLAEKAEESVADLADPLNRGNKENRENAAGTEQAPDTAKGNALSAFWVRALILGLLVVASVVFARSLLPWLSMPGTLSLLPMYGWYGYGDVAWGAIGTALLLPLGVLLLEVLTGIRLWCKWLCPQAVLLSLAALVGRPFVHVRWDAEACKCAYGHRPCGTACSLGLRSRQRGGPSRGECVQCAACVAACQCKGTGALRVGLPVRSTDASGA